MPPKYRLCKRERRGRVDVARNRQRRVAGVVVTREERPYVVQACRAQIVRAADRQPVVRMVGREQRVDDGHAGHAVRAVLVVLPPLVEDDVALIAELLLGQRGEQVAHPVRFHPQRQLERAGRHNFPVVRAVGVGRPVEHGPCLLERLEVAVIVVLGAFEHQVFEKVREAGASGLLVLRAHVVPQADRHDRAAVVLVNEHRQAVPERVLRERDVHGRRHQPVRAQGSWLKAQDRTSCTGITGVAKLAIDTCAASCSAAETNARAAADSGSPITRGSPASPPRQIGS